jgi:hypothetical protein
MSNYERLPKQSSLNLHIYIVNGHNPNLKEQGVQLHLLILSI